MSDTNNTAGKSEEPIGVPSAENEAPAPAPEELVQISSGDLAALREQAGRAAENWERYLRAVAELDNYKKRAARERDDARKYANEALMERFLPIMDNFDAALGAANTSQSAASLDSLKQGITMILGQIKSTMVESGLEEVDASGQVFDPKIHEAVSQQESAEVPDGQVLQMLRRGYKLRDRLLRPAMVIVAKKPE